jgi:hypothetical protein
MPFNMQGELLKHYMYHSASPRQRFTRGLFFMRFPGFAISFESSGQLGDDMKLL